MAVTEINPLEITGGESEGSQREFSGLYQVITSRATDGPATILRAMGSVVRLGSPYSFQGDTDPNAKCVEIGRCSRPYPEDKRTLWHVPVRWATPGYEQNESGKDKTGRPSENPTRWAKELATSQRKVSIVAESAVMQFPARIGPRGAPIRFAGDKGPVTNAAGEVFDPPPEKEDTIQVYTITGYDTVYPVNLERTINHVNADQFSLKFFAPFAAFRFAKWTMRLDSVRVQQRRVNGLDLFHIAVELHRWNRRDFRGNILGWRREYRNAGYHMPVAIGVDDGRDGEWGQDTMPPKGRPDTARIVDAYGDAMAKPVPLDKFGAPLKVGELENYIVYSIDDESRFGNLRIGD